MLDFISNGLGPQSLATGAGARVAFPCEVFSTPVLDLTVLSSNIELVPAKPGHFPSGLTTRVIVEQFTGTQSTPATVRAGSDAGHVNYIVASNAPSNASMNIGVSAPFVPNTNVTGSAVTTQRIPNAPVLLDITVAATGTGGFTLRVRYETTVIWAAPG